MLTFAFRGDSYWVPCDNSIYIRTHICISYVRRARLLRSSRAQAARPFSPAALYHSRRLAPEHYRVAFCCHGCSTERLTVVQDIIRISDRPTAKLAQPLRLFDAMPAPQLNLNWQEAQPRHWQQASVEFNDISQIRCSWPPRMMEPGGLG